MGGEFTYQPKLNPIGVDPRPLLDYPNIDLKGAFLLFGGDVPFG